jgi:2-amino-4-hydroxy-6-hydroxymethyldihydropteridine diphosphokinase
VREDGQRIVCFIGVGSNVADPVSNCLESIDRIASFASSKIAQRSSLYRTEPVGVADQGWFVNCVVEIQTPHRASTLLRILQEIENAMGRVRNERWGPRTIDLDILLYGQSIIQEDDLTVPHPELHNRRFVLVPMCEIAPYVIHPSYGISMMGLLNRLEDLSAVELLKMGPSICR